MIPLLLVAAGSILVGSSRKKVFAKGGGITVIESSPRDEYEEYEMVVISKDAEKDGGGFHKHRYLVSAKNLLEAKKIATEMFQKELGDADFYLFDVMSDERYRMLYMDNGQRKMAGGGMADKLEQVINDAKSISKNQKTKTYVFDYEFDKHSGKPNSNNQRYTWGYQEDVDYHKEKGFEKFIKVIHSFDNGQRKMAGGGMAAGESFLHLYKLTYPDGKYRVDVYDGYYMSPKEALEKMRISLRGLKAYKYSGVSSDSLKYKQWYDKKDMGYSNTEAWEEVFETKMG